MTTRTRKSSAAGKPAAAKTEATEVDEQGPAEATTQDGQGADDAADTSNSDGAGPGTDSTPEGDSAKPADTPEHQQDGHDAGSGATLAQQATVAPIVHVAGEPQPDKPARGMALPETGRSVEAVQTGDDGRSQTAPTGDTERNGKPSASMIDTSGRLRHQDDAVPTAATGRTAENGLATAMDPLIDKSFGGNDKPVAGLDHGTRAESGTGTDTPAPADERPTYPSTTLTRSSSKAAPTEPEDVRQATKPARGDVQTSTDPTLAAAAMPSMVGDQTQKLVDRRGNEVKPSEFFEVPEVGGATLRRVKHRVSEVYTVRNSKEPSQRLLFTEDQMVPVAVAEALIELHG